jgi:hypothetical protein
MNTWRVVVVGVPARDRHINYRMKRRPRAFLESQKASARNLMPGRQSRRDRPGARQGLERRCRIDGDQGALAESALLRGGRLDILTAGALILRRRLRGQNAY